MSVLTSSEILERYYKGNLGIEPFVPKQVQPASYDFRVGYRWLESNIEGNNIFSLHDEVFNLHDSSKLVTLVSENPFYVLHPFDSVLALSQEYFTLPHDLCALVKSKSSLGRLFLTITSGGAGWIDNGFSGHIVLEIVNLNKFPIKLLAGMRIGQIVFMQTSGLDTTYNGHFQHQSDFAIDKWKTSLRKIADEALVK